MWPTWKQDVKGCGFAIAIRANPCGPNGDKMSGALVLVLLYEQPPVSQVGTAACQNRSLLTSGSAFVGGALCWTNSVDFQ